jgi:acyl-CoA dehydrogenase
MSGGASFNEVFLDGVRVRDDHRLGAEGDGWSVALKTLMTERAAFAEGSSGMEVNVDRVIELFRRHRPDDIVVRDRLIDLWVRSRLGELTNRRLFGSLQPGQPPGPEMSIGKLLATDTLTRASDVVSRILGPALVADIGEWGTFAWSEFVLSTPGARIASGSDEIQRTILGERILGLPREPSVTATVNGTNTSNGRRAQP